MYCPTCGKENPKGARLCSGCGSLLAAPYHAGQTAPLPPGMPESRLPAATTLASFISPRIANAPTTPAFTAPRAVLRVVVGYCSTREIDCSCGPVTIGRAPDNSLIVDDGRVSRQHARIELDGGNWRITDNNSRNGTFVNGARVTSQSLQPGDKIVIGTALLEFKVQ